MKGKWWRGDRHIDELRLQQKRSIREKLAEVLQTGDEQAYVELVKEADPNITRERLLDPIEKFREQRRQNASRGSGPSS
jgi:hypothetical protein